MKSASGSSDVHALSADLSSLEAVRGLAVDVKSVVPDGLTVLINNAGDGLSDLCLHWCCCLTSHNSRPAPVCQLDAATLLCRHRSLCPAQAEVSRRLRDDLGRQRCSAIPADLPTSGLGMCTISCVLAAYCGLLGVQIQWSNASLDRSRSASSMCRPSVLAATSTLTTSTRRRGSQVTSELQCDCSLAATDALQHTQALFVWTFGISESMPGMKPASKTCHDASYHVSCVQLLLFEQAGDDDVQCRAGGPIAEGWIQTGSELLRSG